MPYHYNTVSGLIQKQYFQLSRYDVCAHAILEQGASPMPYLATDSIFECVNNIIWTFPKKLECPAAVRFFDSD